MMSYDRKPFTFLRVEGKEIASFTGVPDENIDIATVGSFGEEWQKFNSFNQKEIKKLGDEYFDIVTPDMANKNTIALDVGCGSGRWSEYLASKVKFIEAIEPSSAVYAAAKLTAKTSNIRITQASINNIPFPDNSFDFAFCLGVLHHVPDTSMALNKIVDKLKPEGYILIYIYYKLENRGFAYRKLFQVANFFRLLISKMPSIIKRRTCDLIALFIYLPLAKFARFSEKVPFLKKIAAKLPLAYYRRKSFYIMRNDTLDRFGTPLEKRFSREEIKKIMEEAGLINILFSEDPPYWHAIGQKKQ